MVRETFGCSAGNVAASPAGLPNSTGSCVPSLAPLGAPRGRPLTQPLHPQTALPSAQLECLSLSYLWLFRGPLLCSEPSHARQTVLYSESVFSAAREQGGRPGAHAHSGLWNLLRFPHGTLTGLGPAPCPPARCGLRLNPGSRRRPPSPGGCRLLDKRPLCLLVSPRTLHPSPGGPRVQPLPSLPLPPSDVEPGLVGAPRAASSGLGGGHALLAVLPGPCVNLDTRYIDFLPAFDPVLFFPHEYPLIFLEFSVACLSLACFLRKPGL